MFLARYLGPNDFGVYNYLISIITLLSPLTALGLNAVVVRDLVDAQREDLQECTYKRHAWLHESCVPVDFKVALFAQGTTSFFV
ncbi:oligosaccharide flippase family protein [Klebsiella pneumoniae]|uniref:oligosaccharide flippase family protein n=1 Tax=Klebsiella pneumoniae TaxID=573 RepID=UPI003F71AF85